MSATRPKLVILGGCPYLFVKPIERLSDDRKSHSLTSHRSCHTFSWLN